MRRSRACIDCCEPSRIIRGVYLSLYVILDLFSRYVVGWMVSRKENAGLARHLFTRVLAHHAIRPDTLIVHQDRGSSRLLDRKIGAPAEGVATETGGELPFVIERQSG